ncbi:MAG: DNA mismatch endonuclease Vsr [Thermoanaerobaculia bacterium]
MSLVRSSGTQPELRLEELLARTRRKFKHVDRSLPGGPDFAFPGARKAIFLHGWFWHRHRGCARTRVPKTKRAFWLRKFDENVRRDRRVYHRLNGEGWSYMVVWECQLHVVDKDGELELGFSEAIDAESASQRILLDNQTHCLGRDPPRCQLALKIPPQLAPNIPPLD